MPATTDAQTKGLPDRYLQFHAWLLAGYALFGKWFAYVGVGGLYLGELALAGGILALILSRSLPAVLRSTTAVLLILLMAWCAARTIPYVGLYGLDALRDAAIWGYGIFALVVAGLVSSRPARLLTLLHRYEKFARMFLVAAPVILFIAWYSQDFLSGHGVEMGKRVKPGDTLVHLGGIAAFFGVGLGTIGDWRLALLAPSFVMAASITRGGLLAFLAASAIAFMGGASRKMWRTVVVVALVIVALAVTNIGITAEFISPGTEGRRELSSRQLITNFVSIGSSDDTELTNNKVWRLLWWRQIALYTFAGSYFWTGKGFGINLADDDGFQVPSGELRSPHNGHLTFLARTGVPGLLLWVLTQGVWAWKVLRAYRLSRARHERTAGVFLFLLAYWVAIMVNATFDVVLEGPMQGVWFWTIYGLGIACVARRETMARLLSGSPPQYQDSRSTTVSVAPY